MPPPPSDRQHAFREARDAPAAPSPFSFPKTVRLRKTKEFEVVFAEGVRVKAGPLLAVVRPNGLAVVRLGLAVSKKVGKAYRRNRVKRLFREGFRTVRVELPPGYDVILIPLDRKRRYTLEDVRRGLRRVFAQVAAQAGKTPESAPGARLGDPGQPGARMRDPGQ